MSYFGQHYLFYYPQYISGYEKVKITTTTQTITMETEPLTKKSIVIFGATGDLCKRKLIPALFELYEDQYLPENFRIVGTSRRMETTEGWIKSLGEYPEEFLKLLHFQSSDLEDGLSLQALPVTEYTTFFLSVPPERYDSAVTNLKSAGLMDNPETRRVIIEKPFGSNLHSAKRLQEIVTTHLRERQVYRIDHYLGKDTVNNILATRFSNVLLEPLWNRDYISEVQIFATENIGCSGRAQYYDHAGAVRDMLQNHMMQILSLIAMEPPCRLDAKEIRREKVKVLAASRLGEKMIMGQYSGYKDEHGVKKDSQTPTYVAGDIYIDNWRWKGVPFYFMTGKKLPYQCCEVVIKLKEPTLNLFPGQDSTDRIVIRFQPDAHLDIRIDMKTPGIGNRVETATLTHEYPVDKASKGYTKLIYEAINGDQSNFVHAEEVLESWRIVDNLLCVGASCPVRTYPLLYHEGTWGPQKVSLMTNWDYPA